MAFGLCCASLRQNGGSAFELTPKLHPQVSTTTYSTHRLHQFLAVDAAHKNGPNIGARGINLTITFLSRNRSALAERLCRSISQHLKGFRGQILAVDNGSDAQELSRLRVALEDTGLPFRLVELGENLGVARGRNAAFRAITTEWALCLDDDMYFIGDPLTKAQADIAQLGCRFANLPFVQPDGTTSFGSGGHLYVGLDNEALALNLGGGFAFQPHPLGSGDIDPVLGTFLFGGAAFIHRDTFRALEGFDENLFVGFEDTEFSVRIFQAGLKIGSIGTFNLVHDHPPTTPATATDYDRVRYSYQLIKASGEHVEARHGLNVWNRYVEGWLRERGQSAPEPVTVPAAAPPKPRLALITDSDNWAFANIADQLSERLKGVFEFEIIPWHIFDSSFEALLAMERYDLVHFFWRTSLAHVDNPHSRGRAQAIGIDFDALITAKLKTAALTTAVYDHLFLDVQGGGRYADVLNSVDAYYTSSAKLRDIYSSIPGLQPPSGTIPDAVDPEIFVPVNLERLVALDRPLKVGWVGNSAFSGDPERDIKGVRTVLRPAIASLQARGIPVELVAADRAEAMIPHHEMGAYYAKIDVLVCASESEGTPNPVLEAMACGVPVVSTDVGIVPEVLGELQRKYILPTRSSEALERALADLAQDRSMLQSLSHENLQQIKAWHWKDRVKEFERFFLNAMAGSKGR